MTTKPKYPPQIHAADTNIIPQQKHHFHTTFEQLSWTSQYFMEVHDTELAWKQTVRSAFMNVTFGIDPQLPNPDL